MVHSPEATVSQPEHNPIRRSIEVEYWVVDETGRLVEPGSLVDISSGAEREFVEPLLEIKTTPCESTADLRAEFFERLERILQRADELDKGLVPLSTPVTSEEIDELPSARTRIQNQVVGESFQYVRHCAGTHIHVEQQPGREVDQLNTLIALDPALALVNSSPFFRGERLAMGARSKLYRRMGYDDVPHQGWLWRYIDDHAEWDRRLERRYDEFVTAALDEGVDRQTLEANFDPESAVWTPVQLRSEFGTVEWRSPDAALPSQVVELADQIAETMTTLRGVPVRIDGSAGHLGNDEFVLPSFDAVLEYVDSAIETGLDSDPLRAYLERMGFDVDAFQPCAHEFDGQERVDAAEAREIRLAYADRLRRDVLAAQPAERS